jgi:pyruvate/2-oxoglutarate dehydrogenase complex dihydrolipoamide acyltransferase (E2) component
MSREMTSPEVGSTEIHMPSPGEAVREATLVVWLKQPGDPVEAGEVLAEALTDKANVEIPSPVTGTLAEILAAEGAVVPVGQAIARIMPPARERAGGT